MPPAIPLRASLAAFALAALGATPGLSQNAEPAGDALAGFERLIGTWTAGVTTQRFEWGVGRLVVRARSTVADEDGARVVSEGIFLHDPLRDEVRGYFAAVDMPATYFEYSARWQGDTLIANLTVPTAAGDPRRYVERWEFADPDRFRWSLREGDMPDGQTIESAEFRRAREGEDDGPADGRPDRGAASDTASAGEGGEPPGGVEP